MPLPFDFEIKAHLLLMGLAILPGQVIDHVFSEITSLFTPLYIYCIKKYYKIFFRNHNKCSGFVRTVSVCLYMILLHY